MNDLLSRLAVALAIGLLVGLERGWHTRDEQETQRAAGFRTFALSGLLGGVAGALAAATGPVVLGFFFIGYTGAFAAFHWLEAKTNQDIGATSVVAGMLTFVLGAYAVLGYLKIAIACAVATTLMLALREPLHRWIKSLRWEEIRAALILLSMSFLLLPFLPNRTIDVWDSLNPAEIWLIAIMVAAISFGGYVAVRIFGDRLGIVMAAIAGGLASSTATTLTLSRLAKQTSSSDRLLAGGILLSCIVMVARIGILATLLNFTLAEHLLLPLTAGAIVLAVAAAAFLFRNPGNARPVIEINNPLELGAAIKLAAIIAIVLVATQATQTILGQAGIYLVSAAAGVTDVDAITISMARLGGNQVALDTAVQAVLLATGINTLAKSVIAGWVGGARIGRLVGFTSILALAAGSIALILF